MTTIVVAVFNYEPNTPEALEYKHFLENDEQLFKITSEKKKKKTKYLVNPETKTFVQEINNELAAYKNQYEYMYVIDEKQRKLDAQIRDQIMKKSERKKKTDYKLLYSAFGIINSEIKNLEPTDRKILFDAAKMIMMKQLRTDVINLERNLYKYVPKSFATALNKYRKQYAIERGFDKKLDSLYTELDGKAQLDTGRLKDIVDSFGEQHLTGVADKFALTQLVVKNMDIIQREQTDQTAKTILNTILQLYKDYSVSAVNMKGTINKFTDVQVLELVNNIGIDATDIVNNFNFNPEIKTKVNDNIQKLVQSLKTYTNIDTLLFTQLKDIFANYRNNRTTFASKKVEYYENKINDYKKTYTLGDTETYRNTMKEFETKKQHYEDVLHFYDKDVFETLREELREYRQFVRKKQELYSEIIALDKTNPLLGKNDPKRKYLVGEYEKIRARIAGHSAMNMRSEYKKLLLSVPKNKPTCDANKQTSVMHKKCLDQERLYTHINDIKQMGQIAEEMKKEVVYSKSDIRDLKQNALHTLRDNPDFKNNMLNGYDIDGTADIPDVMGKINSIKADRLILPLSVYHLANALERAYKEDDPDIILIDTIFDKLTELLQPVISGNKLRVEYRKQQTLKQKEEEEIAKKTEHDEYMKNLNTAFVSNTNDAESLAEAQVKINEAERVNLKNKRDAYIAKERADIKDITHALMFEQEEKRLVDNQKREEQTKNTKRLKDEFDRRALEEDNFNKIVIVDKIVYIPPTTQSEEFKKIAWTDV